MFRHSRLVYGLLLAAWILILAWQVAEHRRVRASERAALILRSRDITTTLGLVIRSQRRFGGMVSQGNLESALTELVQSGELTSIALLNAAGEVMVSAGPPIDLATKGMLQTGTRWEPRSVTIVNLVDLGSTLSPKVPNGPPSSCPAAKAGAVPRRGSTRSPAFRTAPPDFADPAPESSTNTSSTNQPERAGSRREGSTAPASVARSGWTKRNSSRSSNAAACTASSSPCPPMLPARLHLRSLDALDHQHPRFRRRRRPRPRLAQPGLVLGPRAPPRARRRTQYPPQGDEPRRRRARPRNPQSPEYHSRSGPTHLPTGPGLDEVRARSREIIDETDRVTAQLNEFINYSRPREVRRTALSLGSVVAEVVRALGCDIEDKQVNSTPPKPRSPIEADEQLLRQALFNLLLNAIQAVGQTGQIQVVADRLGPAEAFLEVRDNGPGVPRRNAPRSSNPTSPPSRTGTGLGLAVVQQIVLAHGWEIECLPNTPKGAIFRINISGSLPDRPMPTQHPGPKPTAAPRSSSSMTTPANGASSIPFCAARVSTPCRSTPAKAPSTPSAPRPST
jgi:hypothetical protein